MKTFADAKIHFTFIKLDNNCNEMISVMEENYNGNVFGLKLTVTDLS